MIKFGDEKLGKTFFKFRDYTPIPLICMMPFVLNPTVTSACLGTFLICFGEIFRIYSVSFIGAVSRSRKNNTGGSLITEGPFAFVRNPLYVGNFFIVFGLCLFIHSLWFAGLSVFLFAFQYYHIVLYEEKILEDSYGEEYINYKKRVNTWFPRKLPRLNQLDSPKNLGAALKSERRTFFAILACLTLLLLSPN